MIRFAQHGSRMGGLLDSDSLPALSTSLLHVHASIAVCTHAGFRRPIMVRIIFSEDVYMQQKWRDEINERSNVPTPFINLFP